jgi:hypothetical protein
MSVTRRGAGCGGPARDRRVVRDGTGSSRATPRHCARRRRWSVPPVALEQTCNAPRAERRDFPVYRGNCYLVCFPNSHTRPRAG